jgi:hypothetical protein
MQINPQTPIVLNLNVEATNVILGALSTQPYDKVAGLIAAIQQQAGPQLQPAEAPQDEPTPAPEAE